MIFVFQDEEAFCVADLGQVYRLFEQWNSTLPNVKPFFAVKAYNDLIILKIMARLGLGFDCASLVGISQMLTYVHYIIEDTLPHNVHTLLCRRLLPHNIRIDSSPEHTPHSEHT